MSIQLERILCADGRSSQTHRIGHFSDGASADGDVFIKSP